MLLEYTQAKRLPAPQYKVISKTGTENVPVFTVVCNIGQTSQSDPCKASNKKRAEQLAAHDLLVKLGIVKKSVGEAATEIASASQKPYISQLIELVQQRRWSAPTYEQVDKTGTDNAPTFTVICSVTTHRGDKESDPCQGPSLKVAKDLAAKNLLEKLGGLRVEAKAPSASEGELLCDGPLYASLAREPIDGNYRGVLRGMVFGTSGVTALHSTVKSADQKSFIATYSIKVRGRRWYANGEPQSNKQLAFRSAAQKLFERIKHLFTEEDLAPVPGSPAEGDGVPVDRGHSRFSQDPPDGDYYGHLLNLCRHLRDKLQVADFDHSFSTQEAGDGSHQLVQVCSMKVTMLGVTYSAKSDPEECRTKKDAKRDAAKKLFRQISVNL